MRASLHVVISFALMMLVALPLSVRAEDKDTLQMLELFGDVLEKVRQDYVEEVDENKLIELSR